jgi:uncharacterized membrane protein YagU involved in acid resistance
MDLLYATIAVYVSSGKYPERMFNYIAGGVFGLAVSMKGGTPVAFLGLLFHFTIALSFTLFFFWIFPRLKFLSFNKYLVGILYGIFVNLTMTFIILPLTPLPPNTFNLAREVLNWYIFGVVFGIPIAYNTYKYYGVKTQQPAGDLPA